MAKISRKQAESLVRTMIEIGSTKEEDFNETIESLVEEGIVSSGRKLGERTFVSPEQQEFYNLGKAVISETKEFWKTNPSYQKLRAKSVRVTESDENGNPVLKDGDPVVRTLSTEPTIALKHNKLMLESFEVNSGTSEEDEE